MPSETVPSRTSRLRPLATWIAVAVWSVWVAIPSLLLGSVGGSLKTASSLITPQIGSVAVAYLDAAPRSVLVYVIVSYVISIPVLLLLAMPIWHNAQVLYRVWMRQLGVYALCSLGGMALVGGVTIARGASLELIASWASRLAWYGLIATLPQSGWVFGVALLSRRKWVTLPITLAGLMVASVASPVLLAKGIRFPTPLLLRAELLSGQAEVILPSMVGLVVWGVLLALPGVAVRVLATRRAPTLTSTALSSR